MKVSTRDKASHYQMPLQKLMIIFMLFIITDTDKHGATTLAQRALDLVREEKISHETTLFLEKIVTISAGVYVFCVDTPPPTASSVIDIADAALYRAKNGGKNRIEVSE